MRHGLRNAPSTLQPNPLLVASELSTQACPTTSLIECMTMCGPQVQVIVTVALTLWFLIKVLHAHHAAASAGATKPRLRHTRKSQSRIVNLGSLSGGTPGSRHYDNAGAATAGISCHTITPAMSLLANAISYCCRREHVLLVAWCLCHADAFNWKAARSHEVAKRFEWLDRKLQPSDPPQQPPPPPVQQVAMQDVQGHTGLAQPSDAIDDQSHLLQPSSSSSKVFSAFTSAGAGGKASSGSAASMSAGIAGDCLSSNIVTVEHKVYQIHDSWGSADQNVDAWYTSVCKVRSPLFAVLMPSIVSQFPKCGAKSFCALFWPFARSAQVLDLALHA